MGIIQRSIQQEVDWDQLLFFIRTDLSGRGLLTVVL